LAQLPAVDLTAQLARLTGDIGIALGDLHDRMNFRLILRGTGVYDSLTEAR
jgi:hypothetical protein